jgi:hypothetical protein
MQQFSPSLTDLPLQAERLLRQSASSGELVNCDFRVAALCSHLFLLKRMPGAVGVHMAYKMNALAAVTLNKW